MIGVFTLWETSGNKVNAGFRTSEELAISISLSVEQAKKYFEEVHLVTNTVGKELLIDKYKIPFDEVKVVLDFLDDALPANLWAYAKIFSYSIQDKPFCHIDNDVYIFQDIPEDIKTAHLFFQNKEDFKTHKAYDGLIKNLLKVGKKNSALINNRANFAYNCGVVGCNDLSLIREWAEAVKDHIFNPLNFKYWVEEKDHHSQNHLFEQYFISSIISKHKLDDKVKVLIPNFSYSRNTNLPFKITHLWGDVKRNPEVIKKVRKRLYKDYPQYIEKFKRTHDEIFTEIYEKELWGKGKGSGGGSNSNLTAEYREFLQNFFKEKNVKSVIDIGSGDWQFSKLIDWDGIEYLGIDCVKSVVDETIAKYSKENIKFACIDVVDYTAPECDVLIIKDVLIHWNNQQIKEFIERNNKPKYIITTNDFSSTNANQDINVGSFHRLDLSKEPFNFTASETFYWADDLKVTIVICN